MIDVGIVGVGTYLPEKTMKAAEIARLTNGVWSEKVAISPCAKLVVPVVLKIRTIPIVARE